MLWKRSAALQALVVAGLIGTSVGVPHPERASAGPGPRRADMLAAGVDMTPVGSARQVDRARQLRGQKP